jgi:hypothetical protein
MRARDNAKGKAGYKQLRNRVSFLVRGDKQRSNMEKLAKSRGNPRVLWELANAAMGKNRPTLPASLVVEGVKTEGDRAAAAAMNTFYVTKVDKLREKIADAPPPPLSD